MSIEDDTIVPPQALNMLLQDFRENPYAGFIEGVELGRWNDTYVGAWMADDIYEPTVIKTIMPPEDRATNYLQHIDAGGFFCFMAKRETYVDHNFDTFQNNGMGPDAEFGISLRQQGYSNFIDWRIQCIHKNGDEDISMHTHIPIQVGFEKRRTRWSYFRV
jgi:hypothetical protein